MTEVFNNHADTEEVLYANLFSYFSRFPRGTLVDFHNCVNYTNPNFAWNEQRQKIYYVTQGRWVTPAPRRLDCLTCNPSQTEELPIAQSMADILRGAVQFYHDLAATPGQALRVEVVENPPATNVYDSSSTFTVSYYGSSSDHDTTEDDEEDEDQDEVVTPDDPTDTEDDAEDEEEEGYDNNEEDVVGDVNADNNEEEDETELQQKKWEE